MFRVAGGLFLLLSIAGAQNQPELAPLGKDLISTGRECPADDALRIGHGVAAPSVLSRVEPKYTEQARKEKVEGTVILTGVIDPKGHACGKWSVRRRLGLGLDESAVAAVSKWVFKPGLQNGEPAPVVVTIEVNFHLL
jgi:TonB family protein